MTDASTIVTTVRGPASVVTAGIPGTPGSAGAPGANGADGVGLVASLPPNSPSLIDGRLDLPSWGFPTSGSAWACRASAETIVELDGTTRYGTLLNTGTITGCRQFRFIAPYSGSCTLYLPARWPTGISTGTCTLAAFASDGTSNWVSTTCTLAALQSTFSASFTAVNGTEYIVRVSGSTQVLVGRMAIVIAGGTGVFA